MTAEEPAQIVAGVSHGELLGLAAMLDEFPEKNAQVWMTLSDKTGGRYSPERLAQVFGEVCQYLGEPTTTTMLSRRLVYESRLTKEEIIKFPFLNFGYHALSEGPPVDNELVLHERDVKFKCNIDLYRLWLTRALVHGKDVVEVGCGRGAGASFLSRYYQPASYTGVDGCRQHVKLCSEVYPDIRFVHGTASALPLADGSADLVLNVESSHCYSDLGKFFSEVHRVLRDGGVFVLTDILVEKSQLIRYLNLLDETFVVTRRADITKNVAGCLAEHGADQFRNVIDSRGGLSAVSNYEILMYAGIFLPIDITPWSIYRSLAVTDGHYVSFVCEKRARTAVPVVASP